MEAKRTVSCGNSHGDERDKISGFTPGLKGGWAGRAGVKHWHRFETQNKDSTLVLMLSASPSFSASVGKADFVTMLGLRLNQLGYGSSMLFLPLRMLAPDIWKADKSNVS